MKLVNYIRTSGQTMTAGALVHFGTTTTTYAVGFVASIVISRAVGPVGRGEYYVSVTAAATFIILMDLSLALVQTYFYAEKKYDLPAMAQVTSAIGLVTGPLAVAGMFAFFVLARHSVFRGIRLEDFAIAAIAVPFQLSTNWIVNVFVLSRRIARSQIAMLIGGVVQTGGAAILYALHRLDVHAVLLLFLAATVVPWILSVRWAERFAPMRPVFNRLMMRDMLRFALRLHPGFIFWFLLLRFDTFLVKSYLGSGAVGRYSLAVLLAGIVWMMTHSLAVAALPFQSEADRGRAGELSFKVARFSLAISSLLAVVAAATLWIFIPVVYGPGFSGAYPATLVLLPGMIAMATARPIQNVLLRQGRPWALTLLSALAFAINVALDVVLLRPFGIIGASLASTAAYLLITGAFIAWASRAWKISPSHALWPQAGDADTLVRLLGPFRARLRTRGGTEPGSDRDGSAGAAEQLPIKPPDGAAALVVADLEFEAPGADPVALAPLRVADSVAGRRSAVARLAGAVRGACSGPYWAPAVLVCGGFLLDSVWTSHPAPTVSNLTVGRIVLFAGIVLLVAEALWRRPRVRSPGLPAVLLVAGLVGGVGVIGANAALHGTLGSQGSFAGYGEFVVIVLLVLALTTLAPRFSLALLLATAAGVLISDVLALSKLQGAQFGGTSRLVGAFGNPNYLAFATALGLSVMLGAWRFVAGRMRIAILLALPVILATLVLTYSRSGLIAAFAGTAAALALIGPNLRARLLIAAGAILVAAAAAVALGPAYQHLRLKSDYAFQIASGLPDHSGWDPSAEGFINGGSQLRNPSPGLLQVTLPRAITGVSYPLGMARRGGFYQLSLFLRTSQPNASVSVGMEDNYAANGPVSTSVSASRAWRAVKETWRPTADSPHARFYVWANRPGVALYLRDVTVTASVPNGAGLGSKSIERIISTQLLGAQTAKQAFSGRESTFVKSRIAAARLSWKLFLEHPLFGVGWERYSFYADRELSQQINAGSPHDDYLRMAAELGIPGVLFLLICVTAVVSRLRQGRLSPAEQVAAGTLAAAGVALFFITALETPSITLSLAAALGVLCASPSAKRSPAPSRPASRARGDHSDARKKQEVAELREHVVELLERSDEQERRSPARLGEPGTSENRSIEDSAVHPLLASEEQASRAGGDDSDARKKQEVAELREHVVELLGRSDEQERRSPARLGEPGTPKNRSIEGSAVHRLLDSEEQAILDLIEKWAPLDRSYRKLAHRGSYTGTVFVSPSTMQRVALKHQITVPGAPPRPPRRKLIFPEVPWEPNRIWMWEASLFPAAGLVAYAIVDVVTGYWLAYLLASEQLQVQPLFASALEEQGLHDAGGTPGTDSGPILVGWSENGAEMIAAGTPTATAYVESFFGLLKSEWPRLSLPSDPHALDEELARIRDQYNTVRLHAGVGYVTPSDEHHGRGPQIRAARDDGLRRARAERIKRNRG